MILTTCKPITFALSLDLLCCVCFRNWLILLSSSLNSLLQNRPLFLAICPGSLWARDNRWLLSRVQRLAGPAGGTGTFCPGWRHQPGQNGSLLSRLVAPTGTKSYTDLLSRLITPPGIKSDFLSRVKSPPGTKPASSIY